ncbi:NADP-dependent oxidoreductase [Cellulomonas shaoxiangyii]|uniref:NADP-dependent oxidoreductase n=1 Tax=Cellulomonas shaoxiangyii TaxID=2566013 RepID=A0A4P7SFY0_9CELL|nr:NADP-dependent oxidoreductase [Cellulomonas shaoxiangyii]QCB92478.1 NADP-dependent oxidoreductase [Cellulomonas shaoxiangyii]TGY84970.1 NADP-dependent oxidoreductase [Cellulomonas shaoxiangyii]
MSAVAHDGAAPVTVRAVVLEEFGGPEVLRLATTTVPAPGPGQVRVHVEAAAVNGFDGKVRAGVLRDVVPVAPPTVLGLEVAGTVDAVGAGVTGVAVGDRVAGWTDPPGGGYAEQALLRTFARVPEGLDAVRAVTVPVAGETAARVLRRLGVRAGETLLVLGASGAVGEVTVQLAVAAGARVVGTASPRHHDRVRAAGAVPVAHGDGWADRVRALAPQGVDAVLDAAGRGGLVDAVALAGGPDRVVTIADGRGPGLGVEFSDRAEPSVDALADQLVRVADGRLVTTVGAVLPLADAPAAHALVDGGHPGGKVVLVP